MQKEVIKASYIVNNDIIRYSKEYIKKQLLFFLMQVRTDVSGTLQILVRAKKDNNKSPINKN